MSKSIETIRAEAKAAIEAKIKAAKEAAEISLLTNEVFQEAQVNQALRDMATDKLNELTNLCTSIVDENPIVSKVLKTKRIFKPNVRYGFGNQMVLLSGLLSGIQFSVQEHAQLMYQITGLTPDLVESTLQHLGQLPYYSPNYNEIVPGSKGDAEKLYQNILLIESILGITIDKSLIKQDVMDRLHQIAQVKAEKAQAEADLTATMQDFILQ